MKNYVSDVEAFRIGRVGPLNFARMLAKIAHCYAIARFGSDSFEPMLPALILGRIDWGPLFVGGDASAEPPDQADVLHDVFRMDCRRGDGPEYLGLAVRLFAMMGMPRYHVIVGRCLKKPPVTEKRGDTIAVKFPFQIIRSTPGSRQSAGLSALLFHKVSEQVFLSLARAQSRARQPLRWNQRKDRKGADREHIPELLRTLSVRG